MGYQDYVVVVINPNSTKSMTDALSRSCDSKRTFGPDHDLKFVTGPSTSPASINSPHDAQLSADACWPMVRELLEHHLSKETYPVGFLVACYSEHPLVERIREAILPYEDRATVIGIFEASVYMSLKLIGQPHFDSDGTARNRFGIISTGKVWEDALDKGVHALGQGKLYAGCETTGLNAVELHDLPPEEVRLKMKEATKRLLARGGVDVICLGCAGMVGLEKAVEEACKEANAKHVRIVDSYKAGVLESVNLLKFKFVTSHGRN